MGENVLKSQVKNFRKGTDRSLKDMAAPTLFNRPDIVSTVYTAAPIEGCAVAEGDHLEAHASADGRCINLVKGHVCVGRIDGDGGKSLIAALREPGGPVSVPMDAKDVSAVSGFFKVTLAGVKGEQ
jgi:hypothetical protein